MSPALAGVWGGGSRRSCCRLGPGPPGPGASLQPPDPLHGVRPLFRLLPCPQSALCRRGLSVRSPVPSPPGCSGDPRSTEDASPASFPPSHFPHTCTGSMCDGVSWANPGLSGTVSVLTLGVPDAMSQRKPACSGPLWRGASWVLCLPLLRSPPGCVCIHQGHTSQAVTEGVPRGHGRPCSHILGWPVQSEPGALACLPAVGLCPSVRPSPLRNSSAPWPSPLPVAPAGVRTSRGSGGQAGWDEPHEAAHLGSSL